MIFKILILLILNLLVSNQLIEDETEKYFSNEEVFSNNDQPSSTTSTIENVIIKVGQQAVLPCFINNLGSYKVIWSKNGDILALSTTKINSDIRLNIQHRYLTEWNLIIDNVIADDEGEYVCKTNGNFFKIINLQILMPPHIDDVNSTPAGTVILKEGSNLSLKCYADAKPEPVIKWYRWKKYKSIQTDKEELDFIGNEIVISSIGRSDPNMYECIARNSVPPATSRIFNLDIHFLPIVELDIRKTFQFVSKKFQLECKITANPIDKIYWYKNGVIYEPSNENEYSNRRYKLRSLSQNGNSQITSGGIKVEKSDESNINEFFKTILNLNIINAKKQDFGEYQCCAVNSYGQICSNILVQEIRSETTIKPTNTTIIKSSTRSELRDNKIVSQELEDENEITTIQTTINNLIIDLNKDKDKDKRRHFMVKSKQFLKTESDLDYDNKSRSRYKSSLLIQISIIQILFIFYLLF